jgi:hypothetical protein
MQNLVTEERVETRYADDVHVGEVVQQISQDILDTFGHHIHPHSITSTAGKPHVKVSSS